MANTIQGSVPGQGVDWRNTAATAGQVEHGKRLDKAKVEAGYGAPSMKISMEVSISAKTETMRLLLQSVMTNIGEALKPYMDQPPQAQMPPPGQATSPAAAANATQAVDAGSVDNSPEATAQRILSFATGFYESFKTQHKDMGQTEVTDHFLDVIKSGIEQGFKEAREILDGLGVLQGNIATNVDKTYELVQKGLADFRNKVLGVTPQETQA